MTTETYAPTVNPKVWDKKKADSLWKIATQLFKCDQHEQHDDFREHCGACCLKGYLSDSAKCDGMTDSDGPNYAGWARCYVQAGRKIPMKWFKAFCGQLESDNLLYADALKTDIATFGVKFQ